MQRRKRLDIFVPFSLEGGFPLNPKLEKAIFDVSGIASEGKMRVISSAGDEKKWWDEHKFQPDLSRLTG